MKERILQFLKTNAKLAGVQENYLKEVADFYAKSLTDETKIEATFSDGVVDFIKLNFGEDNGFFASSINGYTALLGSI